MLARLNIIWFDKNVTGFWNITLVYKVFYLHAPDGIGRSKLVEKMGKAFIGITMTARNLNTVNKLAVMVDEYT